MGLGDQDTVTLGRMIANAYPVMDIAWWMSAAPMAALVLVTLSFLLLSEVAEDR